MLAVNPISSVRFGDGPANILEREGAFSKPKTEAKLQEAHDFWHQDVTTEKVHNFLFQKIKFWK